MGLVALLVGHGEPFAVHAITVKHMAAMVSWVGIFAPAGTPAPIVAQLNKALNAALADPEATTVVYMGRRTFPALAAKLIAQGLAPDTPALLAESLGQADERLVRTTIAALAERLTDVGAATAAAVILFGALAPEQG